MFRSQHKTGALLASLLFLCAAASPAGAQEATPAAGFALDRYNPAERGSEWFVMDSLDLRGRVRPALGVTLEYGHNPLVIAVAGGGEQLGVLVESQIFLHAGGSLVLWDRLRLGVSLPMALYQSGATGTAGGFTVTGPDRAALGDLRAGLDLRLFGVHGDPITAAIGAQLFVPTGRRDLFTGDGQVRLLPRFQLAGDYSFFTYAAMLGFHYRAEDGGFAGKATGSEITFGASAGARLLDGHLVLGPELYGSAVIATSLTDPTPADPPLELILGGHYTAGSVRMGLGAGPGLSRGLGTPAVRVLGSIEWAPPPANDTDKDTIVDPEDACPTVPGARHPDPAKNGCPPDRDGDTIADAEDACPDVPGVRSADPTKNGCPADRDGDTIADAADACPDVPGVASPAPLLHGCPVDRDTSALLPLDRDRDRVRDDVDRCPDVPGLAAAPADLSAADKERWERDFLGCPEDIDGDTIKNIPDACPRVPGKPNKDPSKHGCPLVYVDDCQIKITDKIYFKTQVDRLETVGEKGRITTSVLQAVLDLLKSNPKIALIEIQGHASQDSYPKNQELSDGRAASVVKWLVTRGIPATMLQPKGYGTSRPVPGLSIEKPYKELHQRVEFHIIEPRCNRPNKP